MRRSDRSADPALARDLFTAAPSVSLATLTPDGVPVLRTLNGVVLPDAASPVGWSLAFHGAPAGEKTLCVGQRAVIGTDRIVADIPSWFTSPERACPATTWYLSAQARGALTEVDTPDERAAVLQTLMERFQPEGRHRRITAGDPLYDAAVRNLLVVRLRPDEVTAKVSVGQDKPVETRDAMRRGLWTRGAAGDVAALATSLRYAPDPWPSWLTHRSGALLHPHVPALPGGADAAFALLQGAEWSGAFPEVSQRRAFAEGAAFVGALDDGQLVAVARAVTDGGKFAWLADVYVHPDHRGRGLGAAVAELVLDHPAVRSCARVCLRTRIAEGFWARYGFSTFAVSDGRPWMGRLAPTP